MKIKPYQIPQDRPDFVSRPFWTFSRQAFLRICNPQSRKVRPLFRGFAIPITCTLAKAAIVYFCLGERFLMIRRTYFLYTFH